jgi:hypothetical protein
VWLEKAQLKMLRNIADRDQRREDGSLKPLLSTDVPISKKDEPSLDKDSYIRCSQLHSVEVDSVEYVGTIAPIFMLLVDKSLALCLGLEEQMGITVSPDRPAIALSPKREKFTGRDLAPIKSLPTRKRGKKVKRRRP